MSQDSVASPRKVVEIAPPWHGGRNAAAGYAMAAAGAALAIVVAAATQSLFGLQDLSLVFIVAVLLVASRTSTGPAVAASLLCFLGYNFFFFEPRYTFYISAREGIVTIALFLLAALVSGRLASRLSMRVEALRRASFAVSMRQRLGERLAAAVGDGDVAAAARAAFEDSFGGQAWIRLEPGVRRQGPAAEEHGWWFLSLSTPDAIFGTVGVKLPESREGLDADAHVLAQLLADDVAQALRRTRLASELDVQRVANEAERLRSALLASVSHDLRTPLAGMLGAAESLENYGDMLGDEDRRALLRTVREDGHRLDRYIQNLLDMTRIGRGDVALSKDWIGVDELIGSALGRLRRYQPEVSCVVQRSGSTDPVLVHPALLEQAIFNVVENAAKFSPAGEAVVIRFSQSQGDGLVVDVVDRGPGIPESERERVFDMFYSADRGDRGHHGTGLGLAICRGIVAAHDGSILALGGPDGRGTMIRIALPLPTPPEGRGR